ncbi:hypothetical protein PN290_00190 [Romboutsia sp. 1001216sp1]|uniref:hypothetical protein n=1 Tax=unclassified Romboutsia TaxID=2626894 RepID=UPI0018A9A6CC|nr:MULTISPECIES: hypothetical protein [unclassified Romboutsia]MDB8794298.1 hypothetical protein [Romboutsia sp. 1001216sp1]MDB8796467.1 hypothetical protein [Romboutsia sp. 1001216sp1]MDB8797780.1 hypothetical protein [Romboutsia sp. 1001216sp1]
MYNFLSLIFSAVTIISAIAVLFSTCLLDVANCKYSRFIRCVHLYSNKILFYCLFIGGCIHLIF